MANTNPNSSSGAFRNVVKNISEAVTPGVKSEVKEISNTVTESLFGTTHPIDPQEEMKKKQEEEMKKRNIMSFFQQLQQQETQSFQAKKQTEQNEKMEKMQEQQQVKQLEVVKKQKREEAVFRSQRRTEVKRGGG